MIKHTCFTMTVQNRYSKKDLNISAILCLKRNFKEYPKVFWLMLVKSTTLAKNGLYKLAMNISQFREPFEKY